MINLYTPSEELWNTLSEEHFKAKYWMIKQFGGEKRYEAMRDGLLRVVPTDSILWPLMLFITPLGRATTGYASKMPLIIQMLMEPTPDLPVSATTKPPVLWDYLCLALMLKVK